MMLITQVEVEVIASGSVEDFNTTLTALPIALLLGIDESEVTVTVTPSSVLIMYLIDVANPKLATAFVLALQSYLASADGSSQLLGVPVTHTPSITVRSSVQARGAPPASPAVPALFTGEGGSLTQDEPAAAGALIGGIVGCLLIVSLIVVLVIVGLRRRKKSSKESRQQQYRTALKGVNIDLVKDGQKNLTESPEVSSVTPQTLANAMANLTRARDTTNRLSTELSAAPRLARLADVTHIPTPPAPADATRVTNPADAMANPYRTRTLTRTQSPSCVGFTLPSSLASSSRDGLVDGQAGGDRLNASWLDGDAPSHGSVMVPRQLNMDLVSPPVASQPSPRRVCGQGSQIATYTHTLLESALEERPSPSPDGSDAKDRPSGWHRAISVAMEGDGAHEAHGEVDGAIGSPFMLSSPSGDAGALSRANAPAKLARARRAKRGTAELALPDPANAAVNLARVRSATRLATKAESEDGSPRSVPSPCTTPHVMAQVSKPGNSGRQRIAVPTEAPTPVMPDTPLDTPIPATVDGMAAPQDDATVLPSYPAGLSSWLSSGSGLTLMSARNACSRAPHPQYPERCLVSDKQVDWSAPFPSYRPARFTHPDVLLADRTVSPDGWADPADPRKISEPEWAGRFSYEHSSLTFDSVRRPRNPVGRTGVEERGLLECWGPNHRVDPVITRFDPAMPEELQVLAVCQACRSRGGRPEWAICGGVLEPGDRPYAAAKRVFVDEVRPKLTQQLSPVQLSRFNELVDELFEQQGQVIHCGYFDDAHNTDNAWIESTAFHFHCSPELGALVALHATEDDNEDTVSWLDVCALHDMAASHPSQQQWLDLAARRMLRRDPSAQTGAPISPTYQLHRVIPTQPPVARHIQLQPAGEDEGSLEVDPRDLTFNLVI